MSVTYKFMRYRQESEIELEDLEGAMKTALYHHKSGEASGCEIKDGDKIYTNKDMLEYFYTHGWLSK
ncbi:hypothetical protein Ga0466249_003400 [Sporomusaceae bacterium BoRhaA]|uniref:hypothetical protein n=1 Tax=Pelorhabdus rhamnosifermentans TaxID=2772457 RepID=UPI001C0616FD|nr:hypothetical protein [Pelorhabdus rhamnosifermentans]MBU2702273.1 hypothetical protein [Pelorhabdus rhamnosifermentans]